MLNREIVWLKTCLPSSSFCFTVLYSFCLGFSMKALTAQPQGRPGSSGLGVSVPLGCFNPRPAACPCAAACGG